MNKESNVKAVDPAKYLDVVSVRLSKDHQMMSDYPIHTDLDAVRLVGDFLCSMDREIICMISLQADGRPICAHFASMGGLSETICSPRELLKASILANAASMIMVHNHPSGADPIVPSEEDARVTDRMMQVCQLVGIPLLDHIIVSGDNTEYFSFRYHDQLPYPHIKMISDYKNIKFPEQKVAENNGTIRPPGRHR